MSPEQELSEKTERLLRLLREQRLDGVLLGSQHNFAWLSGGRDNGLDLSGDEGSSVLLVGRDGRRHVLASAIEMPRVLAEDVAGLGFEPAEFPWAEQAARPGLVAELAGGLAGPRLGADWPCPGAQPVEPQVMRARAVLTAAERDRLRQAGRAAGEVMGRACRALPPGLAESEVARRVQAALAERGLRAVVTLVAADERIARFRHPIPTPRPWRDALMVVVCARAHGLTVSLTRLIHRGPVPDELQARTRAAAAVSARVHAATRPARTGAALYAELARAYAQAGFPGEERRHHQGGACGYRTRDWIAHPQSEETVHQGQAFAWNPSITGTKVEDTCVVDGQGLEWVTRSPEWPYLETTVEGASYPAAAVLAIPA